jgi:murein L,D-transpeptidase YcbB/YkuD
MRFIFRFLILVSIVLFSHLSAKGYVWSGDKDSDFFDDASAKIEERVSAGKQPVLDKLYKELYYAPIWVKSSGLSPFGKSLLGLISNDETVTPSVKFYDEIGSVRKSIGDLIEKKGGTLSEKVALELAMSKLYAHYARYRIYGGISWGSFKHKLSKLTEAYKIKVGWEKYAPPSGPANVLGSALAEGDLKGVFEDADPVRFQYKKLRNYLVRYIRIAKQGGWSKLPKFGTIKPGASSSRIVPLIRKRLSMIGDLQGCSESMETPKYDPCLVKAVKRFQLRHGLKGNGVVGKATRKALGQTVTQAIQKIRLNLDRIKWLSRQKSNKRMELNIPSFRLNFFSKDKLVTTIRVVTGKPNHPTPSFHNVMKYIVVNPWWKIPESIVRHEMLSRLIRDPYHYEAQGKELHKSWDETSPRVDPGTVSWSKYRGNKKPIPYYFMQVPSRHNALGKIKFLFPNGYQVYIHDTPSKSLFFRNTRAFSHGCMRIQKPRELLESLALFNDNIDVDGVMKQLEGTEKKTIVLNHYVPIDITYMTAFVDPYGNLNFRKDVYHYDKYQMKDYATKCVSLVGFKPKREKEARPKKVKSSKSKPAKQKKAPVLQKKAVKKIKNQASALTSPEKKKIEKMALLNQPAKKVAQKTISKYKKIKKDVDGYNIVEIYEN